MVWWMDWCFCGSPRKIFIQLPGATYTHTQFKYRYSFSLYHPLSAYRNVLDLLPTTIFPNYPPGGNVDDDNNKRAIEALKSAKEYNVVDEEDILYRESILSEYFAAVDLVWSGLIFAGSNDALFCVTKVQSCAANNSSSCHVWFDSYLFSCFFVRFNAYRQIDYFRSGWVPRSNIYGPFESIAVDGTVVYAPRRTDNCYWQTYDVLSCVEREPFSGKCRLFVFFFLCFVHNAHCVISQIRNRVCHCFLSLKTHLHICYFLYIRIYIYLCVNCTHTFFIVNLIFIYFCFFLFLLLLCFVAAIGNHTISKFYEPCQTS